MPLEIIKTVINPRSREDEFRQNSAKNDPKRHRGQYSSRIDNVNEELQQSMSEVVDIKIFRVTTETVQQKNNTNNILQALLYSKHKPKQPETIVKKSLIGADLSKLIVTKTDVKEISAREVVSKDECNKVLKADHAKLQETIQQMQELRRYHNKPIETITDRPLPASPTHLPGSVQHGLKPTPPTASPRTERSLNMDRKTLLAVSEQRRREAQLHPTRVYEKRDAGSTPSKLTTAATDQKDSNSLVYPDRDTEESLNWALQSSRFHVKEIESELLTFEKTLKMGFDEGINADSSDEDKGAKSSRRGHSSSGNRGEGGGDKTNKAPRVKQNHKSTTNAAETDVAQKIESELSDLDKSLYHDMVRRHQLKLAQERRLKRQLKIAQQQQLALQQNIQQGQLQHLKNGVSASSSRKQQLPFHPNDALNHHVSASTSLQKSISQSTIVTQKSEDSAFSYATMQTSMTNQTASQRPKHKKHRRRSHKITQLDEDKTVAIASIGVEIIQDASMMKLKQRKTLFESTLSFHQMQKPQSSESGPFQMDSIFSSDGNTLGSLSVPNTARQPSAASLQQQPNIRSSLKNNIPGLSDSSVVSSVVSQSPTRRNSIAVSVNAAKSSRRTSRVDFFMGVVPILKEPSRQPTRNPSRRNSEVSMAQQDGLSQQFIQDASSQSQHSHAESSVLSDDASSYYPLSQMLNLPDSQTNIGHQTYATVRMANRNAISSTQHSPVDVRQERIRSLAVFRRLTAPTLPTQMLSTRPPANLESTIDINGLQNSSSRKDDQVKNVEFDSPNMLMHAAMTVLEDQGSLPPLQSGEPSTLSADNQFEQVDSVSTTDVPIMNMTSYHANLNIPPSTAVDTLDPAVILQQMRLEREQKLQIVDSIVDRVLIHASAQATKTNKHQHEGQSLYSLPRCYRSAHNQLDAGDMLIKKAYRAQSVNIGSPTNNRGATLKDTSPQSHSKPSQTSQQMNKSITLQDDSSVLSSSTNAFTYHSKDTTSVKSSVGDPFGEHKHRNTPSILYFVSPLDSLSRRIVTDGNADVSRSTLPYRDTEMQDLSRLMEKKERKEIGQHRIEHNQLIDCMKDKIEGQEGIQLVKEVEDRSEAVNTAKRFGKAIKQDVMVMKDLSTVISRRTTKRVSSLVTQWQNNHEENIQQLADHVQHLTDVDFMRPAVQRRRRDQLWCLDIQQMDYLVRRLSPDDLTLTSGVIDMDTISMMREAPTQASSSGRHRRKQNVIGHGSYDDDDDEYEEDDDYFPGTGIGIGQTQSSRNSARPPVATTSSSKTAKRPAVKPSPPAAQPSSSSQPSSTFLTQRRMSQSSTTSTSSTNTNPTGGSVSAKNSQPIASASTPAAATLTSSNLAALQQLQLQQQQQQSSTNSLVPESNIVTATATATATVQPATEPIPAANNKPGVDTYTMRKRQERELEAQRILAMEEKQAEQSRQLRIQRIQRDLLRKHRHWRHDFQHCYAYSQLLESRLLRNQEEFELLGRQRARKKAWFVNLLRKIQRLKRSVASAKAVPTSMFLLLATLQKLIVLDVLLTKEVIWKLVDEIISPEEYGSNLVYTALQMVFDSVGITAAELYKRLKTRLHLVPRSHGSKHTGATTSAAAVDTATNSQQPQPKPQQQVQQIQQIHLAPKLLENVRKERKMKQIRKRIARQQERRARYRRKKRLQLLLQQSALGALLEQERDDDDDDDDDNEDDKNEEDEDEDDEDNPKPTKTANKPSALRRLASTSSDAAASARTSSRRVMFTPTIAALEQLLKQQNQQSRSRSKSRSKSNDEDDQGEETASMASSDTSSMMSDFDAEHNLHRDNDSDSVTSDLLLLDDDEAAMLDFDLDQVDLHAYL